VPPAEPEPQLGTDDEKSKQCEQDFGYGFVVQELYRHGCLLRQGTGGRPHGWADLRKLAAYRKTVGGPRVPANER
jgi:hypothetical protein